MMIKIENKDAVSFHEELLSERNAFAVIIKHAYHFRVKVIEKDKLDDI